nr:carboxyl transferase domain-containing protein [Leptospira kmetyi]
MKNEMLKTEETEGTDSNDFRDIELSREELRNKNRNLENRNGEFNKRSGILQKVLIANRGEIAKRFILALQEEGIQSVAVVADQDKGQSWFEFANEVVYIGEARNYANISVICAAVIETGANAVYPGYGFLSEDFRFVERLQEIEKFYNREIIFMGPKASVMRKVGNKLDARRLAIENGIPLFQGSGSIRGLEEAKSEAERIGFPVILKLDAGGGGKGMLVVRTTEELAPAIESATRIGKNSYENDTFYLEKFIEKPAHFEIQIFNGVAVGIRKCAVQRRNQKIIEESGETFLDHRVQLQLLSNAEKLAEISGYVEDCGAGTVEFLLDRETGQFGFLEMNTRLQVEYTVTDQSLGIDLAKWQIFLFDDRPDEIQYGTVLRKRFGERSHSIQCRIYAEDPFQNYSPSPGKIKELELPTFNGIRCDFGFKKGDRIPGEFDPMVGKLVSYGKDRNEALQRMERALSELYIRGITTNVEQLLAILRHHRFRQGDYDNRLLDEFTELTIAKTDHLEESMIYACIGESIRQTGEAVSETFRERDLARIVYSNEESTSPNRYKIWIQDSCYQCFLLRTGLGEFWIAGDRISLKRIRISRSSADGKQFLAESENRSVSVRIDAKPNFHLVRFTSNSDGKLHYARLKISSEDRSEGQDEKGFLRSPFQGTFVKIYEDPKTNQTWAKGGIVSKGDALIMISAMKMETVLRAPIDGTLDYLVENGNVNKLVRGKTASGQILGKSFTEGELLVRISSDNSEQTKTDALSDIDENDSISEEFSILKKWNLIPGREDTENSVFEKKLDTEEARKEILRFFYSWTLGYSKGETANSKIGYLLNQLNVDSILKNQKETDEWKSFVKFFIKYNVSLRKLFSSDIGSMHSHFGELQRSLLNWDTEGFMPYKSTSKLLAKVFSFYGVKPWTSFRRVPNQGEAFYNIVCAYKTQREERETYARILEKLNSLVPNAKSTYLNLRVLLALEEREREPKLEATIRKIIGKRKNLNFNAPEGVKTLSKRHVNSFISFMKDPWSFLSKTGIEKKEFLSSLQNEPALVPSDLSERVQARISDKIAYWKTKGKIRRLYSPISNHCLYHIERNENKEAIYLLIVLMDSDALTPVINEDGLSFCYGLETEAIRAASFLQGANVLYPVSSLRLEMIAFHKSPAATSSDSLNKTLEYEKIFNSASSMMEFFLHGPYDSLTLEIEEEVHCKARFKTYSFFFRDGKLRMDLIGENDIRFPYSIEKDAKDSKLYEKGKWPLERWVEETFDASSYREILIPGLDFSKENSDPVLSSASQKVGAKIFFGKIAGAEALFFLKDSRVAGGATGDKEGKKYLAAAYIAYRKDIPLYVWNDGAGANIKEGMVALNRASEGFFINALLTHRVKAQEFRSAIETHNDSVISNFLMELENVPDLNFKTYRSDERPNLCFVIAVGVGSSTGLDVYGSSQASIQVLLDEEQSYRVLTGSSVIESVTGEKLTNYEIGGAKVMGRGTGTVDFVANDKLHLISYLYRIQSILTRRETQRSDFQFKNLDSFDLFKNILSERKLKRIADGNEFLSVKETYSGSESLVAGLFSFGGTPIVALGPRTEFGFHSYAALIKAKESVRIAQKTNSGLMLVYGSKWFRSAYIENGNSLRARRDFQKLLQDFDRPLVHIVKHPEGLSLPELSSVGDVWILVRNEEDFGKEKSLRSLRFSAPEQCATITVASEEEAFSTASLIFNLLNIRDLKDCSNGQSDPKIPNDPSNPYDMETTIIREILDADSFLEFYKDDPGKSLITGLGRIGGKTIGVIADQPKDGGAPDALGTEKFRVFMEFLSKHDIPLLMLSDAPGFVPGTKQERLRIQQIGGESLDVNVLSANPVVSVVLRQNYGGRQIHAFSGFLRPGISYHALQNGTLAVMGAHSAFDLFQGANVSRLRKENKEAEIEILRKEFLDSFKEKAKAKNDARSTGVLDGVFASIGDLRSVVVTGLKNAEEKRNEWSQRRQSYSKGVVYSTTGQNGRADDWENCVLP